MIRHEEDGTVSDPLIDEVRAARRGLWAQFDHDVDRVWAHLKEIERRHADRVVRSGDTDGRCPGDT